jgi:hypothetical protein
LTAVAAIVAKTDGVPLFVDDTKSVMEAAGKDSAAVPATLKDSLMARLDRLGESREVAQIAAVIGRHSRSRCSTRLPRDELAPSHHSITSSARAISSGVKAAPKFSTLSGECGLKRVLP